MVSVSKGGGGEGSRMGQREKLVCVAEQERPQLIF